MQTEDFNKLINGVREKLGEENTSLIADDLAILISDNAQINTDLENKDKEIEKLGKDKENLIKVNGNLLQQVTDDKIDDNDFKFNEKEKEDKKEKPFSFKAQFDKNGEFIE